MTGNNVQGEGNTETVAGFEVVEEKQEFVFHPDNIIPLIVKELSTVERPIDESRVVRMRPYEELFQTRSSDPEGRGNRFYKVSRDGVITEYKDRTLMKDIFKQVEDCALVIRYYSSRGDTYKIYMGKDLKKVAPKTKTVLDDDDY